MQATGKDRARYPLLATYDHCLKCSHLFNLMDARGVISVTERAALMARVRSVSCKTAAYYLDQIGGPTVRRDVRQDVPSGRAPMKQPSRKLGGPTPPVKLCELLFEIGSEEIPAGMLPKAEEELKANLSKLLVAESLTVGLEIETFAGPRRLTAWIRGLPVKQGDTVSEVTGPPKSVAYDAVGEPTRAAVSFAEKQGVRLVDLYLITTPKGEYVCTKHTKRGRTSEQILTDILPRAIHDLSWPRSMTWTGLDGARFIRPIRWIVAVLDGKPVKFSFGGVTCGRSHSWAPIPRFVGNLRSRLRGLREEAAREWGHRAPQ